MVCTFHLQMVTFAPWTRTATQLSRSGTMDQPGLGFIFDCCLNPKYRPFILVVLFLNTCSTLYCSFSQDMDDFMAAKRLFYLLSLMRLYCGLFCTLVSLVWLNCNQNKLQSVITDLNRLKIQLNIYRSPSHYLKEWFFVSSFVFMFWAAVALYGIRDLTNFSIFLSQFFSLFFCYLFSGQFSCVSFFVKSIYTELQKSKKYEEAVACSYRLSNVVDNLCELYKLPILLTISWVFLLSTFNVYIVLYPIFPGLIWLNFLIITWGSCYVYPITLIIRGCTGMKEQLKKFNEHLYWRMVEDKSCQLLNNDKLDLYFIVVDEMGFTACDYFPIDNSLICSMISVATTYLVILLQCEKGDSSQYQPEMNTTTASGLI